MTRGGHIDATVLGAMGLAAGGEEIIVVEAHAGPKFIPAGTCR